MNVYLNNLSEFQRLRKAQGAAKQRTEAYLVYAEGAVRAVTQRFAKSISRAAGSASGQADAAVIF